MQNSGFSDQTFSPALFAEVCENFPEALMILDSDDFIIRYANPAAIRLTGYPLPKLTEKSIVDLHADSDSTRLLEALNQVVELKQPKILQWDLQTQSNESRSVRIRVRLLKNKYLLCLGKSCTASSEEFKQHFEECPELRNRMLQMEKMATIGTLVAGVAHEINTPIGAINSNNDTLRRLATRLQKKVNDSAASLPAEFNQNLKKACGSMNQLTSVSKTALERVIHIIQSLRRVVRQDPEMVETDVNASLESTLTLVAHYIKGAIEVHKDFAAIPKMKCFPSQLNQVFLNLIVNAIQAIDEKGEIFVTTKIEDETILVKIRDTGTGISKDNLAQIFKPGFTTKDSNEGTGLGLSIVKDIIERHHGRIQVSSEPGQGTCFRIFFPIPK